MLIFGYLNTFPNTFWGDGIWYFKYQILFFCIFKFNMIINYHDKTQQMNFCYLFVTFLSANFRLNVHYQSITYCIEPCGCYAA